MSRLPEWMDDPCPVPLKRSWPTERLAHAAALEKRGMEAYECVPACGMWHVRSGTDQRVRADVIKIQARRRREGRKARRRTRDQDDDADAA